MNDCYMLYHNVTCGSVYESVYNQIYIWSPVILATIIGLIFIGIYILRHGSKK